MIWSELTPLFDHCQASFGKKKCPFVCSLCAMPRLFASYEMDSNIPHNCGASVTLVAPLSLQRMGDVLTLQGFTDVTAFEISVERILSPGQIGTI